MSNLRNQAQKMQGTNGLRAAVKKANVGTEDSKLSHPTLDSPESSQRQTYVPPMPQDRFQFLRTFATIPGLRSKAGGENNNR